MPGCGVRSSVGGGGRGGSGPFVFCGIVNILIRNTGNGYVSSLTQRLLLIACLASDMLASYATLPLTPAMHIYTFFSFQRIPQRPPA